MYVLASKDGRESPFFRTNEKFHANDESLANAKPMDDATAKPDAKSTMELSTRVPGKPIQKLKSKHRRGYGRKNKRKNNIHNEQFSIIGTNSAGLKCKKESFFRMINKYSPSIITIQESKMTKPGLIKIPGYQVFERIRTAKKGGGLLTAADENLDPVLVSTGSDETETMTIQIKVADKNIRIINGYGPQEDDTNNNILNYWHEVEAEVLKAKDENCMVIIQMDANAKVGKEIIKDDPNDRSNNGKLLVDLLERQNLTILCWNNNQREKSRK